MPSNNFQVDPKSRQSSGGRNWIGRKLYKERSADSKSFEDEGLHPEPASGISSATGSRSSRHSHKPSLDMDSGVDGHGLSMTAGVITSIPYDSLSDSKTPIPVDYLPRNDQIPVRRDPLPHHLNKGGGDFHQYPSWDPQKTPMNGSQITGPRPPPHGSHITSTASSRERPQTLARPGTSTSFTHGSNGTFTSQSTMDSSTTLRNSFDQASVYSSMSSATRGSSIFFSDASSKTALPSHLQQNFARPSSSYSMSRQSQVSHGAWHQGQPPSFNSATAFSPEGFKELPKPDDERVIEEQFMVLMHKRGWQNLPDGARRQMLAYPTSKKWTLLHQDRLAEWNSEQKRRTTISTHDGILGRADEEGSPEWFVKKVMDDTITPKQLGSLSVSLRTQPIRYEQILSQHWSLLLT